MSTTYPGSPDGSNPAPSPSYYAVIPASVRYCKSLPPAAKLLYGEITALCSVQGFCWASNSHFADLYDVKVRAVQLWIAALAKEGFVRVQLGADKNTRRIFLTEVCTFPHAPAQKKTRPRAEKDTQSIKKSITTNTTETLNVVGVVADGRAATAVRGSDAESERAEGAASPLSVHAQSVQDVDAVVAVTGDGRSRKRFQQLRELSEGAGCVDAWRQALDALNARLAASTGPVERPGAYFCSVLVSGLNARGVSVPVGTPSERRTVRGAILQSLTSVSPG